MQAHHDGWAWIDVSRWLPSDVDRLMGQLTLKPRQDPRDKDPPKMVYCYRENEHLLGVPRMHPVARAVRTEHVAVSDGHPISLEYAGEYRDDQKKALHTFLDAFSERDFHGGILKAPGAWGKTVWASQLIAAMGRTTLILVDREFLQRQWRETLLEGRKDESGEPTLPFLPGAKIGFIQQDRCEFEGYDIAVALVHSMASATREYPPELYDWAGLLITDEVHSFGAPSWAPVAPKFTARYRVGLSATPRRKDGCANAFKWHIGKVIYETDVSRMKPKLRRIFTNWGPGFKGKDDPDFVLLRKMVSSKGRNEIIANELAKAVDSGRQIFAFSSQKKHLRAVDELLRERRPDVETSFYIGGITKKPEEEKAAKKAQVIFTTYQMASKALNVEDASVAFFMTPMGDVEQMVYRITRWKEGKKDAVIVDFIDALWVPYFERLWEARQRIYRRLGALK